MPVSSPPVKNGVVITDDSGTILQVTDRNNTDPAELKMHHGILLPGLINAHCHLELSHLKGCIPEHTGLPAFLSAVVRLRHSFDPEFIQSSLHASEQEMASGGIVGVGDVSNSADSFRKKAECKLRYHTYVECFGAEDHQAGQVFSRCLSLVETAREQGLSASPAPHAPYSVSDELFRLIFAWKPESVPHYTMHNQESEEENKMFRGEPGAFQDFFETLGTVPHYRRSGPGSLRAHRPLFPPHKKMMLIHNTYTSAGEISDPVNLFFCFCPNANRYIENRLPAFSLFKNYPHQLLLGTDSLASNARLSLLEEMKTIQQYDPAVATQDLIRWSTLNAANFFNWQKDLGSLEPGKRPGLNLLTGLADPGWPLDAGCSIERLI